VHKGLKGDKGVGFNPADKNRITATQVGALLLAGRNNHWQLSFKGDRNYSIKISTR